MTINELEQRPAPVMVDPWHEGVIIRREDTAAVADLLVRIRNAEHWLRSAKTWCNDAVIEQMDTQAQWTLEAGQGIKVSAPAPTASDVTWDLDELQKLQDHLPPERYADLVKQTVVYEPQTRELEKAKKAGGDIAAIINRAMRRTPRKRYVRVSGGSRQGH